MPLMLSGMTLAVRASMSSKPSRASMAWVSVSRGPIWRAMNSLLVPRMGVSMLMVIPQPLAFSRFS
ncbi:hypothetical protein D9M71_850800 [compost metagenome]